MQTPHHRTNIEIILILVTLPLSKLFFCVFLWDPQQHHVPLSMFYTQELLKKKLHLKQNHIDVNDILLNNTRPYVFVIGCLYNNANLMM